MKKTYEAPKAEKVVFQYEDAVLASGTGCVGQSTTTTTWTYDVNTDPNCTTTTTDPYNVTTTQSA